MKNVVFENFREFSKILREFREFGPNFFVFDSEWVQLGVKFCFGGMRGGKMGTSLN